MVSGKFLVKTGTAIAMDATIHFMLNQGSQLLIIIGALGPGIVGAEKTAISDSLAGVAGMSYIELTAEELEAVYQYLQSLT